MKIEILDSIHSKVEPFHVKTIKPCLSFEKEYWKQGPFRKERKTYIKSLVRNNGIFLTGLLMRVCKYAEDLGEEVEIIPAPSWSLNSPRKPNLEGIKFRTDQLSLIESITGDSGRGVIKAPTGSGKTVVAMGIMSCYEGARILFLCHTIDLLNQTLKSMRKHWPLAPIGQIGAGRKDLRPITVSTIQSFVKLDPKDYCDQFDIVIVDEAHHVSGFDGMYSSVLERLLAPIRIGFTATLPSEFEKKLALEAYIGPVVGELTIEEATELKILAEPRIKLVQVPRHPALRDLRKYQDIYEEGIVQNRSRNRLVMKIAKEYITQSKSVLIVVTKIKHGELLAQIGQDVFDLDVEYVRGATEGEARSQIQEALTKKQIKCVICTAVWKEGVDIPSLDVLVNAAGGKSELATLQTVGRGLRRTKDKKEVVIVDFLDPYRYLAEHCILRLQLYVEQGWL